MISKNVGDPRRIGEAYYEVQMKERRKQKRVFHVNMLRKWHPPTAVSFMAEEVGEDVDNVVTWRRRQHAANRPETWKRYCRSSTR